jgi:hypothetical protein
MGSCNDRLIDAFVFCLQEVFWSADELHMVPQAQVLQGVYWNHAVADPSICQAMRVSNPLDLFHAFQEMESKCAKRR